MNSENAEIDLWAEVLNRAVDDLLLPDKPKFSKIKEDAAWWFKRKSRGELNSFDSICMLLDLDPSKTRKKTFEIAGIVE